MGMMFRFALAIFATAGLSLTLAHADGLPPPDDNNYNPVPSVPGVPAPGVPAKPQMPAKPAPAPVVPTPVAPKPIPAPEPKPAVPLSSPAKPTPAPVPAGQKQPIHSITNIDVQVAERQPPFAQVTVNGTANTGGWTDIELKPLQTLVKEVGMLSFTLVGTPPSGPATQAMTPVVATIKIDPLPADVKTIRVIGATNEQAQTFR
jgi:outer membrane biosynthesis protein TonB